MGHQASPTNGGAADVRTGQPSTKLTRDEFVRRFAERFYDPAFDAVRDEIERIAGVAWDGYDRYRKSPRARRAGDGFADPEYEAPIEWLDTRQAIHDAEQRHRMPGAPRRMLLIAGAARSDQTCPGEMSKTWRLVQLAREVFESSDGVECDVLDLSHLTSEYGRQILPCKACVSTQCRSATGRAPAIRTTRWGR